MNTASVATDQVTESESSTSRYLGPAEFFRILRRRKTLVAVTIALFTGLTALVLANITPLYSSEAVAIVEMPETPTDDPTAIIAKSRENELRITSFLQLLQSRSIAERVVNDLGLLDNLEFNPNADPDKERPQTGAFAKIKQVLFGNRPAKIITKKQAKPSAVETQAVIDRLMSSVSVDQTAKSNLINVTAYSTDPEMAQRIANKVVTASIQYQIIRRRTSTQDTIKLLNERVTELRQQLIDADQRAASYRKAHGITDTTTGQMQIDRLSSELSGARSARTEAEARSFALDASGTGATSPLLADLQTQETTIQRRVAELSAQYGQGHPDMINAQAQLSAVQRRIAEEVGRVSANLHTEAAVRRSREAQLSGDIGALRAQSVQQNLANVGLMDLERDAETSRTLYVSLLTRLKQLQRQDEAAIADANFESRATLPQSPSYPATRRIMAIAFIASLLIAGILAFTVESIDSRIRTSEQVEQITGTQTLAMIPEIPRSWSDLPPYAGVIERPCSVYAEALRSLHLELSSRHSGKATQIVVITSPLPGEGKTTIAMSLAAAGAAAGMESVVVDLDLRRPGLQNMSEKIAKDADLMDYLDNRASVHEIVRHDPRIPKLAMIGVKHAAKDPGAALASARLPILLGELGSRYRFIVLNSAPILPVRDAKLLAAYADDVLLVAQWVKTPPDALRAASRMLGDKLTGAILNRVDYKKHANLAYGDAIQHYSKYSVYYGDDEEPAPAKGALAKLRGPLRQLFPNWLWSKAA